MRPWAKLRRVGLLSLAFLPLMVGFPGQIVRAAEEDQEHRDMTPEKRIMLLERSSRAAVLQPDETVALLNVRPGQVVGDIGAGTGYFSRRFARAVGPLGRVYAVDIEKYMIDELEKRAQKEALTNIVPILAIPDNSLLPEAVCDLLFLAYMYVHLTDRVAYLSHLRTRLKPGGRIAIVGWEKGRPGPRAIERSGQRNKLSAEQVSIDLLQAGFTKVTRLTALPNRYFLIAEPGVPAQ